MDLLNATSSKSPLHDCQFSTFTDSAIKHTFFFVYAILCPIYTIFGVLGNGILLVAFWKHRAVEAPYTYQVALTVSKVLEVFLCGTFWLGLKKGMGEYGLTDPWIWFQRIYPLVWYVGVVGFVVTAFCWVCTLLLTVAMTTDRVFALWKPIIHRKINHTRHQIIAIFVSVSISIAVVWHGCFLNDIKRVDQRYAIVVRVEFIEGLQYRFMAIVNQTTRVIGVVVLVIMNCLLVVAYRRSVISNPVNQQNDERMQQKREQEKILFLLSLRQALLTCVGQLPHALTVYVRQTSAFMEMCGVVLTPISDGLIMITDMIDFFVVIGISRKMRRIVWKAIPGCGGANYQVTPIQQNTDPAGVRQTPV